MSDHVELRINGLVVYESATVKPPDPPIDPPVDPVDPAPDGDFPPINSGGSTTDMGWGAGHPWFAQQATQNYTFEPSAEWLANPQFLSIVTGYSPQAGTTPPWVRMSINGAGWVFNGNYGSIANDGGTPGFPTITGPFMVTIEQFDGNKQPVGQPYGVAAQLNHNP